MKKLFRFDQIVKKASFLSKKMKKVADIVKIITFAMTCFEIIAVIWSLIPKNESMEEVSGDELIDAVNESLCADAEIKEVTE